MRPRLALVILRRIACLAALAVACHANAASVLPVDLDQMVERARDVVHVRCLGSQAEPDATAGIATVTMFVVLDRVKGKAGALLTLRQAGGALNGQVVDYHVPKFKAGEEYVLFLPAPSAAGFASPVGLSQGAFAVYPGASGKQVGNGRSFSELMPGAAATTAPPAAATSRPETAPATATPPSRMGLDEFLSIVRVRTGGR